MLQFMGSQRVGRDLVTEQQDVPSTYSPIYILIYVVPILNLYGQGCGLDLVRLCVDTCFIFSSSRTKKNLSRGYKLELDSTKIMLISHFMCEDSSSSGLL